MPITVVFKAVGLHPACTLESPATHHNQPLSPIARVRGDWAGCFSQGLHRASQAETLYRVCLECRLRRIPSFLAQGLLSERVWCDLANAGKSEKRVDWGPLFEQGRVCKHREEEAAAQARGHRGGVLPSSRPWRVLSSCRGQHGKGLKLCFNPSLFAKWPKGSRLPSSTFFWKIYANIALT